MNTSLFLKYDFFYLALCFTAFFVLFINPNYPSLFGTWWMSSLFYVMYVKCKKNIDLYQ